jgi:hypothetical protein
MVVIPLLIVLIGFGVALVAVSFGKPDDWNPPIAAYLWVRGFRTQPPARERVRMLGYLTAAGGVLFLILATWFPDKL